ncbi:MAG: acetyl/propionyl-CoA carboxylase subunit alpha [Gammaproteobacteria bacterium]|nr:acetyl/propionyl-CoA carboxylase subunit alpha [Gammaproteobacteria bacterium]|tara:strand:+ start:235 stop:2208 length:1974 start_codon:yes stop_codon:yes gene_type:complete
MFKKILIANRGEIACRVIKTCQIMGISTVAVYSDADQNSMHVSMADESIHIGGSASSESYLVIENIVNACKQAKADAVHPGYGFLSENENFAHALANEGITFIGPKAEAIVSMGDKIQSKKIAERAGVHVIPGFTEVLKDSKQAVQVANEIGYPVMLKASAGGGGKGMRIVNNDKECTDGFERAQNESQTSFGDNRVFAEKYIDQPHHVEIQILADQFGKTLYIGERECSIQRRHQKVIEEAPSPFIDNQTRQAMGKQAVILAKAVNYESAGTVEFIVDAKQNFYFLEMNTRLQVEHPVTEMVSGLDLVEQMILIAAGEPLQLKQNEILTSGSAIEARIYAEDPYREFMPSIGRLQRFRIPEKLESVRVDTGIEEGSEVSMFYDPMIAKLIVHGENRNLAIDNMLQALDQFFISGVSHNLNFLCSILQNDKFRSGNTTTNFIQQQYPDGYQEEKLNSRQKLIATSILACIHQSNIERLKSIPKNFSKHSAWSVSADNTNIDLVIRQFPEHYEVRVESTIFNVALHKSPNDPVIQAIVNDHLHYFQLENLRPGYRLTYRGRVLEALVTRKRTAELNRLMPEKIAPDMSRYLLSPMPGLLIKICVEEGQTVKPGEELAIVEAMKMENSLRAIDSVKIKSILVEEGANLMVDQTILEFED